MENLHISFQAALTLGVYLLTISALYWKMRIDIAAINLEIKKIKCDRASCQERVEKRWSSNQEKIDKQDAVHDVILKTLSDIKADIKELKTNVEWLKKR